MKCEPGAFTQCPGGKRRACGSWHPQREPPGGLTVDDVAAMIPAREIVPMRDAKKNVHLVLPSGLELWEQLTGRSGEYQPNAAHARTPIATELCHSPRHNADEPLFCPCGQALLPLVQLERVVAVCEACRIKRRLPAPRLRT